MTLQRLTIMMLLALLACDREPLSPITTPVTDRAGVMSPGERESLARRVVAHRAATHVQIALLTVPTTDGEPIEDYAHRVAEAWGGGERGVDNGVLVILAVRDHRSRIDVGRGLEASLPDGATRALLDEARPALRRGDYAGALGGIVDGLIARTGGLSLAETARPVAHAAAPTDHDLYVGWIMLFAAVGGGVLIAVMAVRARDRRASRVEAKYREANRIRERELAEQAPRPAATISSSLPAGGTRYASYEQSIGRAAPRRSVTPVPSVVIVPMPSYEPPSKSSYEESSSSSSVTETVSSFFSDSSSSSSSDFGGGGGGFDGGGSSGDW